MRSVMPIMRRVCRSLSCDFKHVLRDSEYPVQRHTLPDYRIHSGDRSGLRLRDAGELGLEGEPVIRRAI